MKTLQKTTVMAVLLGASGLATAQQTDTAPTSVERVSGTGNDDDSGKWGLAGLLGLLGLFGMRRNHEDHIHGRGTNAR